MTATAHSHYEAAKTLTNRIVSGQNNEPLIQAWAGVCRQCAIANDKFRTEVARKGDISYTRSELAWLDNLDRIWWVAQAQVSTLRPQ